MPLVRQGAGSIGALSLSFKHHTEGEEQRKLAMRRQKTVTRYLWYSLPLL